MVNVNSKGKLSSIIKNEKEIEKMKVYMVEFELNGDYRWTSVKARSESEAAFLVENGTIPTKGVDGTYELLKVTACED